MMIGSLIREAWATTWRYRFLWILGLFAGGMGTTVQWRFGDGHAMDSGGRTGTAWPAEIETSAATAAQWMTTHPGVVAAAVVSLLALAVALLVVWLIAQGGMAEASIDLGTGHGTSLGRAWRAGMHLFWRYAGLWLSLAVCSLVVAAIIAAGIAFAAGVGVMAGSNALAAILAVFVGLPLALLALAGAVGVSIAVCYAQRAIAAEDEGPIAALRSGVTLLASHFWESLLTWVVALALVIVSGIGIVLTLGVAAALLMGMGALLWALAGMGAAVVAYAGLGALMLFALLCLLAAIANTFFWHYWTLAYLHLSGRVHPLAA
jgi:hypothetical protein